MTEPHQTHMADAFVSLLITVPQSVCLSGGPERLYLSTRSCETFDCSCMETDILVTEPHGPRRAALRFEPSTRSMEVISNADGLLPAAVCEWFAERLRGDTGAFIEARAKRAKTRGLKAPWRLRSWTDFRPGELIPFHEAVPGEPDLVANVDGIQYWARDLYCVAKHCECYEAVLDMTPNVQARDTPEGFVRIDLHGGEVTSSDHPALPGIYRAIRTTYGIDELRSRYARMRKMAKDPTVQLGAEHSAPVNSAPKPIKVGRNDPCPCGSGKKWKKCCG